MTLEVFNPLEFSGWDDLLAGRPEATVFHTASWVRVLHDAYGYRPCCLAAIEQHGFSALLACMEVRSMLTGTRGVSLPFTDSCEPILSKAMDFHELIEAVADYGRKAAWRSLELRIGGTLPADIPASAHYYHHTLDLTKGETEVFKGLRESTRRNIRNSQKQAVQVTLETSEKALPGFYELNCMTRQRHGLPPQPYSFFEKLGTHLLTKGRGLVVSAFHDEELIAGAVFLHFRDRAVYKYGASKIEHQHLRANNLVMWEAIRWYARHGFKDLSLGRTEPENAGLLQFKRGWGATEESLSYARYDFRHSVYVKGAPKVTGLHNRLFAAMPIPLLRLAGKLLYRHVG